MHRTRGKVFGMVAAVAAAGLLAACGNNDSTATSTPTLTPTTTKTSAAATPGGDAPSSGQPAPQSESVPSVSATERPAPVPSQFITTPSGSPALTDRDKTFLEELKKKGITPAASDIALTAANLVCQGKAEGASDDQILTYVTAIAGSDPSFDESKMSVEQAGKVYVDVATSSFCNK
ncbi:DUF732 domain-containing protein [Nocardia jejuensis]|uniref:DUF732 domain-containing protein n=1 Tax=Nocardia jejuensis TaxID=328049 RepID=UPI0008302B27|nr:DUF732 domain-containing protein [Nocardia jejuensis]